MSGEPSMRFLPLAIDLRGRCCLVVGGGAVGERKVKNLLEASADVTVLSPGATEVIQEAAKEGKVRWVEGEWEPSHLEGAFLVVAATDDAAVNKAVVAAARERGVLCCDASSMERTQVAFGALLRKDGVTVAVFSDGRDPGLSRRTRDRLAEEL